MRIKQLKLAFAAVLIAAFAACDGSSLTGPEEQEFEAPGLRTACMAGGEVAQRAGCPEDTWSNTDDSSETYEEEVSPREKRPD